MKPLQFAYVAVLLAAGLAVAPTTAAIADAAPSPGCYARVYDAAHLAGHRGQIVDHIAAEVSPREEPASTPFSVSLFVSVKGHPKSDFATLGACWEDGDSLLCNASLSAEERGLCKRKNDGVHACRIDYGESGKFRVKLTPQGVLISIAERLELSGKDDREGGDYLYLSPGNVENHAFLLTPAPATACK